MSEVVGEGLPARSSAAPRCAASAGSCEVRLYRIAGRWMRGYVVQVAEFEQRRLFVPVEASVGIRGEAREARAHVELRVDKVLLHAHKIEGRD